MRAFRRPGIAIAAMIKMIETTMRSSIKEKPFVRCSLFISLSRVCDDSNSISLAGGVTSLVSKHVLAAKAPIFRGLDSLQGRTFRNYCNAGEDGAAAPEALKRMTPELSV